MGKRTHQNTLTRDQFIQFTAPGSWKKVVSEFCKGKKVQMTDVILIAVTFYIQEYFPDVELPNALAYELDPYTLTERKDEEEEE